MFQEMWEMYLNFSYMDPIAAGIFLCFIVISFAIPFIVMPLMCLRVYFSEVSTEEEFIPIEIEGDSDGGAVACIAVVICI